MVVQLCIYKAVTCERAFFSVPILNVFPCPLPCPRVLSFVGHRRRLLSLLGLPTLLVNKQRNIQGYCPDGTACRLKHELPDPRTRNREVSNGGDQGVSTHIRRQTKMFSHFLSIGARVSPRIWPLYL